MVVWLTKGVHGCCYPLVMQALSVAEADARLLLSAASAAARDQSLGADGILLVSKQGAHLVGNVASLVSRLRALQDELSTLRG